MTNVQFVGDAQVNGQFVAFAQAAGDLTAVAAGAVADVTAACAGIAIDLGDDPKAGDGKSGDDALGFWCDAAVAKLKAVLGGSGSGQLAIIVSPPSCSASLRAEASCQAKCDVSGKCDVKASPPRCTGGTLEINCKGSCTGEAAAPTIDCTGACGGSCSGSCQASGSTAVDCQGKCDGQCTEKAGVGSGIQGDGTCSGSCAGKCTLKADAKVQCTGTCSGKCDASCHAVPGQVAVTCSGKCDSPDYEPIACQGGKLEGGCQVDANCQANCNASASARAECTPPRVDVSATGNAQGLATVAATLQKHLPALLVVVKARGQGFLDLATALVQGGATVAASGKLDVKGTACLTAAGVAAKSAANDFGQAFAKSGSVLVTIGL
jgi:hypothetical protein